MKTLEAVEPPTSQITLEESPIILTLPRKLCTTSLSWDSIQDKQGNIFPLILSKFAQGTEIIMSWATCHVQGLCLAHRKLLRNRYLVTCHLQACGIQMPAGRSGEVFPAWPYQPPHHKNLLFWLKSFYQTQAVPCGQVWVSRAWCTLFISFTASSLYIQWLDCFAFMLVFSEELG